MINEIIDSILQAESKAEELIAQANTQAKEIVVMAKQESEVMQKSVKDEIQEAKLKRYAEAEQTGEMQAQAMLAVQQAKLQSESKQTGKCFDGAVDYIVRRLID